MTTNAPFIKAEWLSTGKKWAFSTDIDDGSDVPVAVIQTVVVSGGSVVAVRFRIREGGNVVRMEELEGHADEENDLLLVVLGRGRRVKTGSTRYGADWEEH